MVGCRTGHKRIIPLWPVLDHMTDQETYFQKAIPFQNHYFQRINPFQIKGNTNRTIGSPDFLQLRQISTSRLSVILISLYS
jgi:hypothetical protein